jgi:hypothetical protein
VIATGYTRTYAQWLLSHTEEIFTTPVILRRRYGPEVFAAVLVAWILVCSYHLLLGGYTDRLLDELTWLTSFDSEFSTCISCTKTVYSQLLIVPMRGYTK